jgi:hypothetical protein
VIFFITVVAHLIISAERSSVFLFAFSLSVFFFSYTNLCDDGDYDEKEQPLVTVATTTDDRNKVLMSSCLLKNMKKNEQNGFSFSFHSLIQCLEKYGIDDDRKKSKKKKTYSEKERNLFISEKKKKRQNEPILYNYQPAVNNC